MRSWRHFVEQQPAIGVDEELDGEQAHKVEPLRQALCRRLGGLGQHRHDGRRRDGPCQDSVLMPVLAGWKMADIAVCIARQKGADFAVEGDQFLENGIIALQVLQGRIQIIAGLIRRCPLPSYPRRHVFRMAALTAPPSPL